MHGVHRPIECQICSRPVRPDEESALTWVMDRDSADVRWTCPECVAKNVRSIEAQLAPEWW